MTEKVSIKKSYSPKEQNSYRPTSKPSASPSMVKPPSSVPGAKAPKKT